MILTRSIKLTCFFGFGILAFLLVVDADAKQADADHFDAGRDLAPWLAMIARGSAIDALRLEQRSLTEELDYGDPSDSALVMLPPSAEQVETVWSVRTVIDSLDPNEREVIRMQHLQGYSHSEIAEQLGVAVDTVESRSQRAHRRLATRLGHLGQDVDQ